MQMATSLAERREPSYRTLKRLLLTLRASFEFHLDVLALSELGVDALRIDLQEETERGGPYFLPISQSYLNSLDNRPDFEAGLSLDDFQWNWSDAGVLQLAFAKQLLTSRDESAWNALDTTKWRHKEYVFSFAS